MQMTSLASSPDGRWLVLSSGFREQLFLLDWQTGAVLSQQNAYGYLISGLTFDPSSTFVAGLTCHENHGCCVLWCLAPTENFVSQPKETRWPPYVPVPQEVVSGGLALRVVHEALDRTDITWPQRDLADTLCQTAFSPDSKLVFFNPMHLEYSGCGLELVAYEVSSGKRLWYASHESANTGSFILTPDGTFLLVPMEDSHLFVYRVADGMLEQDLPTGLNEPIQALAFDHDGKLWLATEEQLVQYQPQG
jgi:WD40 repeat protein